MSYHSTAIAECPDCGERVPGHVYVHDPAGVYGWTCPICECAADPSVLDTEIVEVDR